MIISRPKPDTGICFAWTPKWTPEGYVWFEWVRFRRVDDAYDIHPWRYERLKHETDAFGGQRIALDDIGDDIVYSQQRYGVNAKHLGDLPTSACRAYQTHACRYPRCTCMNVGGSECPTS